MIGSKWISYKRRIWYFILIEPVPPPFLSSFPSTKASPVQSITYPQVEAPPSPTIQRFAYPRLKYTQVQAPPGPPIQRFTYPRLKHPQVPDSICGWSQVIISVFYLSIRTFLLLFQRCAVSRATYLFLHFPQQGVLDKYNT
ncbi:hypothetical protein F5Y18DRAFT_240281 [Xylariaceae sp. FL1019]|nr:hypothetical protein F5Y18DRAFT_240281 [Xylariaceae sp. FL1019]